MQLSKNFSLKELTASQTADRHGISNNPSEDHMDNLKKLCDNVLQKVRDHYGKVVSVSSGYRSPELCVKIGSSMKSQHAKGQAADFEIFGKFNTYQMAPPERPQVDPSGNIKNMPTRYHFEAPTSDSRTRQTHFLF